MSEPKPLHRLFGLSWMDFCQGTAITVETELDLSLKQQFIDLVLIRTAVGPLPTPLPDGFEDLAVHNLVTFKSHQEALDDWALYELIGHYVNYRKQYSPSFQELLPASDFRLFAVCVRYPQNLAQEMPLTRVRPGVYEIVLGTLRIRVIVVHQLPQQEPNAMLHLFSAKEDLLHYGKEHYRPRSKETSTLLYELFLEYTEDPAMSNKLAEFVRNSIEELLDKLPPEELRKRLSTQQRLEGLPAEERLKGLSAEEMIKALSPEARQALEALLRHHKDNGSSVKPE